MGHQWCDQFAVSDAAAETFWLMRTSLDEARMGWETYKARMGMLANESQEARMGWETYSFSMKQGWECWLMIARKRGGKDG